MTDWQIICFYDAHSYLEGFLTCKRALARDKQPYILCHGLVRCNNCGRLWNRDRNAASNIWKIARNAINGQDRPTYLQR